MRSKRKKITEVLRMSGYSGWFDPICYQFYFYNVNSIGFSPEMRMAYRSFLEEIKPYCEYCVSLNEVPSSIMRKFIYNSGRTQSAQGREPALNYLVAFFHAAGCGMECALICIFCKARFLSVL